MRKYLLIASAAAVALSAPALAKEHGDKGHGGDKHAKHQKHADRGDRDDDDRGHWRGERRADRFDRRERRSERRDDDDDDDRYNRRWVRNDDAKAWRQRVKAEEKFERRAFKADEKLAKRIAKDERKFARDWAKADERAFRFREARFSPDWMARTEPRPVYYRVGQVIPASYYSSYNVPVQYRDFYSDSDDYYYRYDQGNIFQVNRGSNLVSGLIPMLGGAFGVGQLLPAGFDAYNLPMQYRNQYVDSSDAFYRYGDDAIYQVDPQTRMIEGVVALLTGDMNVGQLLPAGYDAYNLPLQYRDQYPDSADQMYRYADGNIYGIDPQTQLIETVISLLT